MSSKTSLWDRIDLYVNHTCKDPVYKSGHILRLQVDAYFGGGHYSAPYNSVTAKSRDRAGRGQGSSSLCLCAQPCRPYCHSQAPKGGKKVTAAPDLHPLWFKSNSKENFLERRVENHRREEVHKNPQARDVPTSCAQAWAGASRRGIDQAPWYCIYPKP